MTRQVLSVEFEDLRPFRCECFEVLAFVDALDIDAQPAEISTVLVVRDLLAPIAFLRGRRNEGIQEVLSLDRLPCAEVRLEDGETPDLAWHACPTVSDRSAA